MMYVLTRDMQVNGAQRLVVTGCVGPGLQYCKRVQPTQWPREYKQTENSLQNFGLFHHPQSEVESTEGGKDGEALGKPELVYSSLETSYIPRSSECSSGRLCRSRSLQG